MLPSKSPFPCQWWSISLKNAGLDDVRPNFSTYGRYEFSRLPPLPFEMRGDFAWLAVQPAFDQSIGDERASDVAHALPKLQVFASWLCISIPESFTKFMSEPKLHKRVRSATDCFLDLCAEPIRSPIGNGWLVRFLADSQGCIFWYLYLTPDGSDHAVVSSHGFYGTESEQWDELPDPRDIVFCSESFEEFICRYWLENEIWYAGWLKTAMPDVGRQYIEHYRSQVRSAE